MRVKSIYFVVSIMIHLCSFNARAAGGSDPNPVQACASALGAGLSYDTSRLVIRPYREYQIRGDGWARTFLTPDHHVWLGVVNDSQQLEVHDVETGERPEVALPAPFPGLATRGEWAAHEGRAYIHLGDASGRMHHLRVGLNSGYESQIVQDGQAVAPLAVNSRGGILTGLPYFGRVRIMPAPWNRQHESTVDLPTEKFLRGAHFLVGDDRDVYAAISRKSIDVYDQTKGLEKPVWSQALAANGETTSVTWFRRPGEQPALVANDGLHATIYFPFEPERERIERALDGSALGRVHALVAPSGKVFIEAPGTLGSRVFAFDRASMQLFAELPNAIARHQNVIFVAPNGRVYVGYTEHALGQPPRFSIAKVRREPRDPIFQLQLEEGEVVLDTQVMNVTPQRQLLTLRTNQRVICREITPATI